MNNVVLIGRLARDPELRFIPGSGMAVANFTMAIDKGLTKDKKAEFQSQGKPTADFPSVIVFGKQAENCSQYLAKGKKVAIQGSIQTSSYKSNDGTVKYKTEVLANRVEFLEWGENQSNKTGTDTNFSTNHIDDDFKFGAGSFEDFQNIEDDDDVPF